MNSRRFVAKRTKGAAKRTPRTRVKKTAWKNPSKKRIQRIKPADDPYRPSERSA